MEKSKCKLFKRDTLKPRIQKFRKLLKKIEKHIPNKYKPKQSLYHSINIKH